MFNKKLCAGMLLCCLVFSGCGNGNDKNKESESVQLFMTQESTEGTQESAEGDGTAESTQEGASADAEADSSLTSGESKENASAGNSDSENQKGSYRSELFEFHVVIGQTEYTLPEDFKTFSDKKWNYDGNRDLQLNPNEYIVDEAIYKGNHLLYVSFVNLGYDMVTIENCKIGSILFDQIALKDANTNIILAGNIKYGESSLADVLEAYGEPDAEETTDSETVLTYGESEYSKVVITVNKTKDVITDIFMMNYTALEQNLEINQETPDIVSSYQAPTKMGTNLQKPLLKYDGAYYSLPAPVSAFVDNGWTFEADEYDAVATEKTCNMYLEKDSYRIKIQVTNYTNEIQYLENCFVTWIQASKEDASMDVELLLPGKIKTGMTETEMLEAIGDVSYKKDDTSDETYILYDVAYENNTGKIRLYVSKETSVLSRIVAKNQPEEYK